MILVTGATGHLGSQIVENLLKQISPSGLGWDGKYNGQDLPSTDYWFSVEFTSQNNEKGIFKSHFSLKR